MLILSRDPLLGGFTCDERFVMYAARINPVAVNMLTLAITDIGMIRRTLVAEILRGSNLSFDASMTVNCLDAHLMDFRDNITSRDNEIHLQIIVIAANSFI